MVLRSSSVIVVSTVLLLFSPLIEGSHLVGFGLAGGTSHVLLMSKIARTLVEQGHEYTFIVSSVDASTANTTGFTQLIYESPQTSEEIKREVLAMTSRGPIYSLLRIIDLQTEDCNVLLADEDLVAYFKDKPADLAVLDNTHACSRIFTDRLGIDHIDVGPVGFYDPFLSLPYGAPLPIAHTPIVGSRSTEHMTFPQRFGNMLLYIVNRIIGEVLIAPAFDSLRAEYNVLPPTDRESLANSKMALMLTNFGFEFPRALPPHVRLVGAVLPEPAKPLPVELEAWMQQPGDVLLGSLGSLSSLSDDVHGKILTGFGALPAGVRVLWKFNGELPAGVEVPANVRVDAGWIPQNDVLGHPKTVAFFSHGGMNGLQEAVYHGVPVIGFATFADQWDNVQRVVGCGMGLEVDRDSFTAESLLRDVTRVLTEASFKVHALRMSRIAHEAGGAEEVARWVDYVLRVGADHLRPSRALEMPWYQLWMLDIFGAMALIVCGLVLFLWSLVRCALGCCFFGRRRSTTKKRD